MTQHVDVLIVGAGLSGLCAAHYLRERCPNKSSMIVEARDALGGTWDLFQYPGIRSDSDMYTLGFSFFPWKSPQAIADGPAILAYLHETATHFGLLEQIHFRQRVDAADWSEEDARWTVTVTNTETGERQNYTCGFLWWCSGYYAYESGYTPDFEGANDFQGEVVHPQHWPPELEWADKRVVVIGSGATAVTLVPELAREAAHVTMLQRSPTYLISLPQRDVIAQATNRLLGAAIGHRLTRWRNVLLMTLSYAFARWRPKTTRKLLLALVRRQLGEEITKAHFSPTYEVWDQRVCVIPDGDLYDALNSGVASVVTDHIAHFTPDGIALRSGEQLDADIIVTATGLRLSIAGGANVSIDGEPVIASNAMMYKGTMLSDVPNSAISIGYTNASWTLKCELISGYICRLLKFMDEHDYSRCRPQGPEHLTTAPLIDFNSGYVQRALPDLPTQGTELPWRLYQNYLLDNYLFGHTRIDDGVLSFS